MVAAITKVKQTTKVGKEMKKPLDPAKVVFLAEQVYRVACENIIYDNPPPETSQMDCIQAERPVPCDLCCTRYSIPAQQFPPSADETILPPFILPSIAMKKQKAQKTVDKLKEKEVEWVKERFVTYEEHLYAEEQLLAPHRYHPCSLYFPKSLREVITLNILKIKSRADLNVILASNEWPFIETQGSSLFDIISSLQKSLQMQCKVKSKKSTRKSKLSLESSDSLSDVNEPMNDLEPSTLIPSKRVPLVAADNHPLQNVNCANLSHL